MMIETLAIVASSILPLVRPQAVTTGGPVAPRGAKTALTTLDGSDGRGVWLWHKTLGYGTPHVADTVRVADRLSYPAGRVDSVRRPGFNGKAWAGESFVGGVESYPSETGSPGAAAYGAVGDEDAIAHLRVGPYVVGVNPFEEIRAEGKEMPRHILAAMEEARNQWLKDRGYVGGVRTFTNPAASVGTKQAIDLTPKAVIPAPTDLPRVRNRMEVRSAAPTMKIAGAAKVSLPPSMSMAAAQPPKLAAK